MNLFPSSFNEFIKDSLRNLLLDSGIRATSFSNGVSETIQRVGAGGAADAAAADAAAAAGAAAAGGGA